MIAGLRHPIEPVRIIEQGTVRTVVEAIFTYDRSAAVVHYGFAHSTGELEIAVTLQWMQPDQMVKLAFRPAFAEAACYAQDLFGNRLGTAAPRRLSFAQRLTMFRDHMGADADPELHAGSFYIYLYIKGKNSKGEREMTWFGLTLFDNRFHFDEERGSQDVGKADASGLFIYQVPIRAFRQVPAVVSEDWLAVEMDVLPYVRRALELAQQRGYMLGVRMEEIDIEGMNMGWEMPGTYDGCMQIRDLSLKVRFGGSEGGAGK